MDILQYVYVFLWAALAVATAVTARKEGATALVMTGFFVFMTVWYGIRAFFGVAMFDGALGVIFKCVMAGFAVVLGLVWYFKRRGQK